MPKLHWWDVVLRGVLGQGATFTVMHNWADAKAIATRE